MKPQPSSLATHMAMSSVALIYGINYFTLKLFYAEGYSSFAALGMRSLVAASFFWGYHALFVKQPLENWKDLARLAACALFGISLNQTFYLWGLQETSQVNSAVLMVLTPVFVFVLALWMGQEAWNPGRALGVAISLGGAVGLILSRKAGANAHDGASTFGDLLIMINAASYGFYLVLIKPLILKYNTFTITKWIFLLGAIPNLSVGIFPLSQIHFGEMSWTAVGALAFLVVPSTIIVYFLNAWSMKRASPSMVGAYIYFQPVFVTLIAAILGVDTLGWWKGIMILFIFLGVYMVSAFGKKPNLPQ